MKKTIITENVTENATNGTKKEPTTFYSWAGIAYCSEEQLKRFLVEQARNWAYIWHDMDVEENGKPKTPHFHFVATFDQRKSFSQMQRMLDLYRGDQNVLKKPVTVGLAEALEYLTHKNDATKYQYDRRKVVISSAKWYERYVQGNDESETDRFVDDLLAPKYAFSVQSMARKYGRDFMRNLKSYMEFRRYALAEQNGRQVIDLMFGEVNPDEEFNTMKGLVQSNETLS